MTCASPREDYIQAVSDLCDMTGYLLQMRDEYVAAVREGDPLRTQDVHRKWRLYTGGITRLLNEERDCFDEFDAAQRRHSP